MYPNLIIYFRGLGKEGGADLVSGYAARGTSQPASDEDAGPGALPGAGEEGQEEGQGGQKWPPPQGSFGHDVRRQRDSLLRRRRRRRGGGRKQLPPEGGRKKRAASTNLEAEASKRGKGSLADNSAWGVDSSPERRPRDKPLAES